MQTVPSGSVPRGHGALPLVAPTAEAPGATATGPFPRTTTRRSGPTVSAETATSTAAIAPARTTVDTAGA